MRCSFISRCKKGQEASGDRLCEAIQSAEEDEPGAWSAPPTRARGSMIFRLALCFLVIVVGSVIVGLKQSEQFLLGFLGSRFQVATLKSFLC